MTYTLDEDKRKAFATNFLLEKMINKGSRFSLLLEGDDNHLEEVLTYMMAKGFADIHNDSEYKATEKGRRALLNFKQRYQDFLKNFDIYCAVDLEEGDFAFEDYWEYEDEKEWDAYLEEERWEDLRVPVAAFKGLDAVEVVFMGMLNEERINDKVSGWQFDLALGTIWDEILKICESAIKTDQLAFENDEGAMVGGEEVLKDIIGQAAKINQELWEEEAQQQPGGHTSRGAGVRRVRAERIGPVIYDNYVKDPYYVNPVWRRYDD